MDTFGSVLPKLRQGYAVSRKGWGEGMRIDLFKGSIPFDHPSMNVTTNGLSYQSPIEGLPGGLFDVGQQGTAVRQPHITVHFSDGTSGVWFSTVIDLLAEDWFVL